MWLIAVIFATATKALPVSLGDDTLNSLSPRDAVHILSIENAQDAWSDLDAGVAPLILLVGERVTKQHLRESTSRIEYYMLGATPLGLITSIISLLRLASIPLAARLIGRSDELIREACREVTPVNTKEVTSVLSGGTVQRGESDGEAVTRLHVREVSSTIRELWSEIAEVRKGIQGLNKAYKRVEGGIPDHTALLVGRLIDGGQPAAIVREVECLYTSQDSEDLQSGQSLMETCISVKVTAVGSEVNYLHGQVRSVRTNWSIVVSSVAAMVAVHIASLQDAGWEILLPWVFVVGGYVGLLFTIFVYGEAVRGRIRTSTVRLSADRGNYSIALQTGNLDKEGTVGHLLPLAEAGRHDFVKVNCLLPLTLRTELLGTLGGILFLISFLFHYLGLRSVQWWVSVGELGICLIMVTVRTLASRHPFTFVESKSVYDTDLRSVGVISPSARKRARLQDAGDKARLTRYVRAHFGIRQMGPITQGDTAAALLASSLKQWNPEKLTRIFTLVGLHDCRATHLKDDKYMLIHAGGTGLLTKEGYLRPSDIQVWAQEITLDQLRSQSLIGWSTNGLMRNEEFEILSEFRGIVTQQIFIPAVDGVLDWWLRSEGMNSWIANCDNLQWGAVLSLGLLFCALDMQDCPALQERLMDASRNPELVSRAVAEELEAALRNILSNTTIE